MSDEVFEPDPEPAVGQARYGLGQALADAWDVFSKHPRVGLGVFAGFHLAGALVAFLLLLAASSLGGPGVIATRLTAGVVVPVMAGSWAVAFLSRHVLDHGPGGEAEGRGTPRRGLLRPDVIGMALVAALAAAGAVLFLGGFGILVLPFFYGPPIAMQFAVTHQLSLTEALQRARATLAGRWHTMLYLFAVALALGIVGIVPVGALVSMADGRGDLVTIAALSLGRGLLVGVFAGFLGAMQISIFSRFSEAVPTREGAGSLQ